MLGGDRGSRGRRKINLGSKPRLLVGTAIGTLATYVLFVHHYTTKISADNLDTWVWFGIRSDGRCGRDFGDTTCGKGHCCSSHGWCGEGEEYCGVGLGCQNGCWPATKEEEAKRDAGTHGSHEDMVDDDSYHDRMHHYGYDGDHHHDYYHHHRRYGYPGHGHDSDYDWHHRYDDHHDDSYHDPPHDGGYHEDEDHHHGEDHPGDHPGDHHSAEPDPNEDYHYEGGRGVNAPHTGESWEHAHPDEQHGHLGHMPEGQDHPKPAEAAADLGPELVGLEEKRHLGTGDGVPLHGEPQATKE